MLARNDQRLRLAATGAAETVMSRIILLLLSLLPLQREWTETFDSGKLNPTLWKPIFQNDFKEKVIDIVDARLRLRADTIGTDDATVKYLGVRLDRKLTLRPGTAFQPS